jgi:hypothetical protein
VKWQKKAAKKRTGYLSAGTIKRYIGPIPESTPGRRKMLKVLQGKATDEKTKALRKLAIMWCDSFKAQREYLRLSGRRAGLKIQ